MFKIGLSLSLLLGTQLVWAAIPPMSKEMREIQASHIVEGRVLDVNKELVSACGENARFKDWNFIALVQVSKSLKAETGAEAGPLIMVKYWQPARRPKGWTGSQGQDRSMSAGNEVRLFMTQDAESNTYHLLTPNGWELLSEVQNNYISDNEEVELELEF